VADVDAFDKTHILRGRPVIKIGGIPELISEPKVWASVWHQSKAELLFEWITKHPGTRPLPWWLFDHKKERPVIHPMAPETEAIVRKQQTYLGLLHTSILHGHGSGGEMWPFQEPEEDYLERLGLLTGSERAALEADNDLDDDDTEALED
jgi:hypothetical protein